MAEIVQTLIDHSFTKGLDGDSFQTVKEQIKFAYSWELIGNVNGPQAESVRKNDTVTETHRRFKEVATAIKERRATLRFLFELNIDDCNTKRLLRLINVGDNDIQSIRVLLNESFKNQTKRCLTTIDVIKVLINRKVIINVDKCKHVLTRVINIKDDLDSKRVTVEHCVDQKLLWGNIEELPDVCAKASTVVYSEVFWNMSLSAINERYKNTNQKNMANDECPTDLSEGDEKVIEDDCVTEYIKCLNDIGIKTYTEAWRKLVLEKDVRMVVVKQMFANIKNSIEQEIKVYESVTGQDIEKMTRRTVLELFEIKKLKYHVDILQKVFTAFNFDTKINDDAKKALYSFENLFKFEFNDETFECIERNMKELFDLTKSVEDNTVEILGLIAESSLLLEFLKEIEHEDVRNLIDAVEDISESHVQEGTVSALIETKKFVQNVLSISKTNNMYIEFLRSVNNLVQTQTTNVKTLPGKVHECRDNLHNLKSLYKNVANRGQQTREIIHSILTKGTFSFSLDEITQAVVFKVSYNENQQKIEKHESSLGDMRSRALLLLNSDRQSSSSNKDEFVTFVNLFDVCQEIRDTLQNLYTAGHIDYITIGETILITDQKDNIMTEFQEKSESLNTIHADWEDALNRVRKRWYLMNYIQGCQIHMLYKYITAAESKQDVNSLLKFIHPEMDSSILLEEFQKPDTTQRKDHFLELLGNAVQNTYTRRGLNPIQRHLQTEDRVQKFEEVVHEGRVLLTVLNEKSELVLRSILSLYQGTCDMLPEPYQLLICTSETTWDEIELLLARCKGAKQFYKTTPLFCLANIELLSNDIQFELVDTLRTFQDFKEFRLALVCRGSSNNPFVDLLSSCVASVRPISEHTMAEILNKFCPNVITFTSEVAGLGKSSTVSKTARRLKKSTSVLHISGVLEKSNLILDLKRLSVKPYQVLHLDIGNVDRPLDLDIFIFQLIVMRIVGEGKHSFWLPTEYICIEIANTINNTLSSAMSCSSSFKREHLKWHNFQDFTVSREINSPIQVVCNYLNLLKSNKINDTELRFIGNNKSSPLADTTCRSLLKECLSMHPDMSFSVANIFLNVLADQLKKFTCSAYFKVSHISDMVGANTCPVIRSSLVSAMVDVARDFASRSVSACRATQVETLQENIRESSATDLPQNINRTNSMIRWEESNHLIYVFHNQDIQTLSVMYRERSKVPANIQDLFKNQIKRDMVDYNSLQQRDLQTILQRVARVQKTLLDEIQLKKITSDYALTPDNLLKMVLIILRISANVPVVVMGETGCGKTSLIRYLATVCEVPFKVFSIHSGIAKDKIVERVMDENKQCLVKKERQRWLFLDEINTSEYIGIICDIMCHHMCNGVNLAPNLVIMGACNPYKLRTKESIHTAGLSGKVKTDDLSKLVYRVLPLPEMVVDYVWDFGSLTDKDELKYIERMTAVVFSNNEKMHHLLRDLISDSHRFVRDQQKSVYSVSLRDVERCKSMVMWFAQNWFLSTEKQGDARIYCNMLLALSICYQSRFDAKEIRAKYRQALSFVLKRHNISLSENDVYNIIKEEQKEFLKRMDLPRGTARNTALQENVFLITVCILNRIPIFVVGKPGCSKSLAMQVIRSNLRGRDSRNELFRKYPQLYCVSFQGSESSTSDGILKVFDKAEQYQKNNTKDDVLSVVILDEVGLAEVSKFNPLKVLHSLLEPDGKSTPNVAVVGISNWSLDASKMNRGIHLSRPDMDTDELFDTAVSICESYIEDSNDSYGLVGGCTISVDDLKSDLRRTANAYVKYTDSLQFKNFHGLRDFYALVKFIAKGYVENPSIPMSTLVMGGLERNFGGLISEKQSLMKHFSELLDTTVSETCVADIIKANIQDKQARHLMIITEGESVLGIIEQTLEESGGKHKETIFGSQFEEDLTDDYLYRILSNVILCMEQGVVLILKDLDNIYGSLYDMLNQNYTKIGKKNNCRVALGPYSNPFCHVSEDFRCIVLVESNKLKFIDPPFLNRFEKQALSMKDIMTESEIGLMKELQGLVNNMSNIQGTQFSIQDMFPYCNEELLASLAILSSKGCNIENKIAFCEEQLLWFIKPDSLVRLHRATDENIRQRCYELQTEYFRLPIHEGLKSFIDYQKGSTRMTLIYTYSNVHARLSSELEGLRVQIEKIGAYKSEKQLSIKLEDFWKCDYKDILIVQCHAVDDGPHILLTKTLIEKFKTSACKDNGYKAVKQVYFIVHLSGRGSVTTGLEQLNFLSQWQLVTMERLEKPPIVLQELCSRSLQQTINEMKPLHEHIKDNLFWSFSRIKYGQRGRKTESIESMIKVIESNPELLNELEIMVLRQIQKDTNGDFNTSWWINVACDFNAIVTNVFFTEALQKRVLDTIRHPLAKLIFRLEEHGSLFAFNINDHATECRRRCWIEYFHDDGLFRIDDIPHVSGPECFYCLTPDVNLKLPHVYNTFCTVQNYFSAFKQEVAKTKIKCELSSDDPLPTNVLIELFNIQTEIMLSDLQCANMYDTFGENAFSFYFEDFCNLFSHGLCLTLRDESRIGYTKWAVQNVLTTDTEQPLLFEKEVSFLHCSVWMNFDMLVDMLHLFETYEAVFRLKGNQDAFEKFKQTFVPINEFKVSPMCVNKQGVDHHLEDVDPENIPINADNNNDQLIIALSGETHDEVEGHFTEEVGDHLKEGDDQSSETDSNLESNDETDMFTSFVKYLCSEMIPSDNNSEIFKKPLEWQILTKRVLLSAENISVDCKEYQSLKIISELLSSLVLPFKLDMALLSSLFNALKQENNIDSVRVQNAIKEIICCKLDDEFQLNACESVRQYLVSCLTLDTTTQAFELPCKVVLNHPEFEVHIHRLYVPFLHAVKFALCDEIDEIKEIHVLQSLVLDPDFTFESGSLLDNLDETVKVLLVKRNMKSPFIIMLIDIFQEVMSGETELLLSGGESIMRDFFLASGQVLQFKKKANGSLRLIVAIAFVKNMVFDECLMDTWNAVLEGLEGTLYFEPVVLFLVRKIGVDLKIAQLRQLCSSKYETIKPMGKVKWTDGYDLTCVENNPFFILLHTDLIVELKQCAVERNGNVKEFSENVTKFINAVQKSQGKTGLPVYVNALAMTAFYLCRHRNTNANMPLYAAELVQFTSDYTQRQQEFVKYIVGLKNFALQSYVIDTETDVEQYMINLVLVTLHAHTLCGNDKSLLMMCLSDILALKNLYLPGFPDKVKLSCSGNKSLAVWECVCGQIVYIDNKKNKKGKCPECKFEFDENMHSKLVDEIAFKYEHSTGFIWSDNILETGRYREIGPVTSAILQLFICASVRGSLAFGFQCEDHLKYALECEDPVVVLDEKVTETWRLLKQLTNFNDLYLSIYLLLILKDTKGISIENKITLQNPNDRCNFEKKVDVKVKQLEKTKHVRVHECIRSCDLKNGLPLTAVELVIRESNTIEDNDIGHFLRLTSDANKEEFVAKLYSTNVGDKKTFPFLVSIIENEKLLYLPQYIYDIIQWHLTTMMIINFKQKSHYCLKYTAEEFHRKITDASLRTFSRDRFKSFRKAMEKVNNAFELFGIDVQNITNDSRMQDCLILDAGSQIFKVLNMLVNIQNGFIVNAMQMSLNCDNLQFLCSASGASNILKVSVVEVSSDAQNEKQSTFDVHDENEPSTQDSFKGDLVHLSESWFEEVVVDESHSKLSYGCGFDIEYNFNRIEKRLAESLLFRKAFIDLDFNTLPHIVFVDELYKTFFSLVEDIRATCPQEQIPNEVEKAIRENALKSNDMATELINELDVLMTVMKRTKVDPSTLLDTYIDERRNTIGKHFPTKYLTSTKNALRLAHIVSLHELLEELCSDQLLEGISDDFKVPLEEDLVKHFRKIPSASFGDILLKALKRFYFRCIEIGNMDTDQAIYTHLTHESFWPAGVCTKGTLNIGGKTVDVLELIPDDVRVANIGSLVATITDVVERFREDDVRINMVIQTFHANRTQQTTKEGKQKKAVKKLKKL